MASERLYTAQYMVLIRPKDGTGKFIRGTSQNDAIFVRGQQSNQYNAVTGEPWIRFSTAYSLEDARRIGKRAAESIGAENVLIVKVVPHAIEFEIG